MILRKLHIVLLFGILAIQSLHAQESDTLYTLDVYAGAGYGYFITDMDVEGLNRGGLNTSIRIMWQPEHLLSVGLQTGYLQFYSFELNDIESGSGTTDIISDLTAVPIGILFSMRILEGLSISAGTSFYILNSYVESHGNINQSSDISIGSILSLTYTRALNKSFAVGGEITYNLVNKIQDGSLSLQAVLKYKLLEY